MKEFNFFSPVKIKFGSGEAKKLEQTIKELGFSKGILICDKLFANNGLADNIRKNCPSIIATFSDITPNPLLQEVRNAAKLMKEKEVDFAIALGGGSSIDLAKFACSAVYGESDVAEYFYKRAIFSEKHIPLIAIPTTAGTGSEVTSVSVCNDEVLMIKAPLLCNNFYPFMAIIDPELTISVPPFITATTGLDAMSHALEAYWSNGSQPICDILAISALCHMFPNIKKAFDNGKDLSAREEMSLGSLLAGLSFAIPKTAGCHGCSYGLSNNYHLCHGEACAFTLDSFIRINSTVLPDKMDFLAKSLGFENTDQLADKVMELKKYFGLKTTLGDIGAKSIDKLSKDCSEHIAMKNNPILLSPSQMKDLFEKLR